VARHLYGTKFKWKDKELERTGGRTHGLGGHLGLGKSEKERRGFFGWIDEKNGSYPESVAEGIHANMPDWMRDRYDTMEVLDAVLSVVGGNPRPRDMVVDYAKRLREQSRDMDEYYADEAAGARGFSDAGEMDAYDNMREREATGFHDVAAAGREADGARADLLADARARLADPNASEYDKQAARAVLRFRQRDGRDGVTAQGTEEDGVRFRFTGSREDFDKMRDEAVKRKGLVMPGLADKQVRLVRVAPHDFTGPRPINQAEEWAKANIVGTHQLTDSEGKQYDYVISKNAIGKFLSASATKKSDGLNAHLSVLKQLPEVIGESIEAEVHPDYLRGKDGKHHEELGTNNDRLVHRFYGAVELDGKTYRVKTTINEHKDEQPNKPHSYEVTEIELVDEKSANQSLEPMAKQKASLIGATKLLQGVEKSYDSGKLLLDESAKTTESGGVSQGFGSAATSLNQVASAMRKIDWKPGTVNVDIGGGRFDKATEYLREQGVESMVFDPFNRDAEHNRQVAERVRDEKVDTVTCNNVLNVIDSVSSRANVILQAAKALKPGGTAYFSVYEGDKSGVGRQTKSDSWQNNRVTKDYVSEIERYFDDVTVKDKVIIAKSPKATAEQSVWDFDGTYSGNDVRFRHRAPNGEESLLDERQYDEVRTGNFKRWFGDWENDPENASKVVDKNGEPLVVYHQTNSKQYINRETGQNWDDLDWREREEWDRRSDEEWNDAWEEQDFYTFDNRHARQSVEYPGFFFSPRYDEHHEYGDRTIAAYLDMKNPAIDPDIPNAGVTDTAGRDAMESLMRQGYDGVIRTEDGVPYEYIVFRPEQIKSATENNGEFSRGNGDFRFRLRDDERRPTFYSNAERAVENVKQGKATAEQWKAMLTKAGGIKAGEDKWMGLTDWLDEHKGQSLTKDEVLQFVRDNGIRMEEVNYGGDEQDRWRRIWDELSWDELYDTAVRRIEERGGDSEEWDNINDEIQSILTERYGDQVFEHIDYDSEGNIELKGNEIHSIREDYTTPGLENKREIAFVVPGIEPYQENDAVHFGPENEGRAVMWVRFGETTDKDGKRVLVIDEVQSNRHQDARERGYITKEQKDADKALKEYISELKEKYGIRYYNQLSPQERLKFNQLTDSANDIARGGIPDAPFEKNWMEVAMKRMLRLAAEEGFDKVAWTTGAQQAERYGIGGVVESITKGKTRGENTLVSVQYKNGKHDSWVVSPDGKVVDGGITTGENLSDLIGKELSEKVMSLDENGSISGDGLRIGGEGMKGFYDQIVPGFMRKYVKKWGSQVGEVELATPGGEVMHSVDVTEPMRDSVMQGQPLFRFVGERGAGRQDAADGGERMRNKEIAEAMERGGKDARAIKLATGWERGKDGKWRHEEGDNLLDLHYADDIQPGDSMPLYELLPLGEDNRLFEAYPELKGVTVEFRDLGDSTKGSYNEGARTISISNLLLPSRMGLVGSKVSALEELNKTLLHEQQHAIQAMEGFAKGGNPWMQQSEVGLHDSERYSQVTRELITVWERLNELDRMIEKLWNHYDRIPWRGGSEERKRVNAQLRPLERERIELIDRRNDLMRERKELADMPIGYDTYNALAGEVEARNVSERMDMTDEQRRQSLAADTEDVARDEQIVRFGNGVSAMGSRVDKRMAEIGRLLEGRDMTDEQRKVADVFSGKEDNQAIEIERADGKRRVVMRQGNEQGAGAKHSVFGHYGTTRGVITAEDVLRIPEVIKQGELTEKQKGKTKQKVYKLTDNEGNVLTVLTEINNRGNEVFADFYSNKEALSAARKTRSVEAQADADNAQIGGKGSGNSSDGQINGGETTGNGVNFRVRRDASGETADHTTADHTTAVEEARRRLESADASEFERQAARAVIKAYGGSDDAPDGGGPRFRIRDDADMLVDMAKHNNEVARQRRDAVTDFVKAITDVDELTDSKFATALGKVMRGQRQYDQATVADITTMVKAMMDAGLLTELDNFSVKQILTKVKDSTGKNDITAEANKLIDIMLKHQLRFVGLFPNCSRIFPQMYTKNA